MNWEVISDYLPMYWEALGLTLRIGWCGILLSIVIGLVTALLRYYRTPILHRLAGAYIELFRNTPLLVQLFFLYFGLPKLGISISAEFCGILGLALLGGAYMAETFRSGFTTVENTQLESALALGMTRSQAMRYVILPQAVSVSVPSFTANVIFLLKETSVFSAISLMDLMFTAKDLIGLYYKTEECLVLLVFFYLLILLPVSVLGSWLERKLTLRSIGEQKSRKRRAKRERQHVILSLEEAKVPDRGTSEEILRDDRGYASEGILRSTSSG